MQTFYIKIFGTKFVFFFFSKKIIFFCVLFRSFGGERANGGTGSETYLQSDCVSCELLSLSGSRPQGFEGGKSAFGSKHEHKGLGRTVILIKHNAHVFCFCSWQISVSAISSQKAVFYQRGVDRPLTRPQNYFKASNTTDLKLTFGFEFPTTHLTHFTTILSFFCRVSVWFCMF